jgi:hypothetical protein
MFYNLEQCECRLSNCGLDAIMPDLDGSEYADRRTPYSDSDPPAIRSENAYRDAASALETSIQASASPTYSPGNGTAYFGLSGSATTPVGGGTIEFGLYSDSYGMFGAYGTIGTSTGIQGLSLGIVTGRTDSLAGESVNVSVSASVPKVVVGPGVSKGASLDLSTGRVTGTSSFFGLNIGPPVGGAIGYTSTTTTEFTILYLVYIHFLNHVGYPGGYRY